MGDPLTPPISSSETDLSWLFPQPPAQSSLARRPLRGGTETTEGGEDGDAHVMWPRDDCHEVLKGDTLSNEQAIIKNSIAAFIVILISVQKFQK